MAYLLLIIAFSLNALANILLKSAASIGIFGSVLVPHVFVVQNWKLILGLSFFALNVVFYFLALRSLSLSVAYPVMVVMTFVLVNAGAAYFFGEQIHTIQIIGYALMVLGIVLVLGSVARV